VVTLHFVLTAGVASADYLQGLGEVGDMSVATVADSTQRIPVRYARQALAKRVGLAYLGAKLFSVQPNLIIESGVR
jgi:hypothetical protein